MARRIAIIQGHPDPREFIPYVERAAERRWGQWHGLALVYELNALDQLGEKS